MNLRFLRFDSVKEESTCFIVHFLENCKESQHFLWSISAYTWPGGIFQEQERCPWNGVSRKAVSSGCLLILWMWQQQHTFGDHESIRMTPTESDFQSNLFILAAVSLRYLFPWWTPALKRKCVRPFHQPENLEMDEQNPRTKCTDLEATDLGRVQAGMLLRISSWQINYIN